MGCLPDYYHVLGQGGKGDKAVMACLDVGRSWMERSGRKERVGKKR
jgi:hypothetical protein